MPAENTSLLGIEVPRYDGQSLDDVCASPTVEMDAARIRAVRALRIAAVFCFCFMIVEVIGGYIANSLAILTDAAHLLTDIGAFALGLYSLHATARGSDHVYSYGYHRAEVVGTLASVFTIWALVGAIVFEAFNRLHTMYLCSTYSHKQLKQDRITCSSVDAKTMMIVGILGLAVNLSCAVILSWGGNHGHSHGLGGGDHGHSHGGDDDHGHAHGGHDDDHGHAHGSHDDHEHSHGDHDDHGHAHGDHDDHDDDHEEDHGHAHGGGGGSMALNAAFLHALGDSVQSVGVILAGGFIYFMNNRFFGQQQNEHSVYNIADPACSLLFAFVTLFTTKDLIRQLLSILMESTPDFVDYVTLRRELREIPGVQNVHDLHIWSLTANKAALSVHLVAEEQKLVLLAAQRICTRHRIGHTTIQVDPPEIGVDNCITQMGCHNC
jgi:zinc transporter 2